MHLKIIHVPNPNIRIYTGNLKNKMLSIALSQLRDVSISFSQDDLRITNRNPCSWDKVENIMFSILFINPNRDITRLEVSEEELLEEVKHIYIDTSIELDKIHRDLLS